MNVGSSEPVGVDPCRLMRQAIDVEHLLVVARRWPECGGRAFPNADEAFAAYLADPRFRTESPNPLFDERFYVRTNEDVAREVREGRRLSGFDHFVNQGVFEGRAYNAYVHRRMEWCRTPAPLLTAGGCEAGDLDDESRVFLERFPHVSAVAYYNGYGRFLGGASPLDRSTRVNGPRTGILVLGMHRSGTSILSAALVAAGSFIGSDLFPPSISNPVGFWESREIASTLDSILARTGSSWEDSRRVTFADRATRTAAVRELGRLIARKFRLAPLFSVKDPRSCRLAGLWSEALSCAGVSVKVVIPVRHPMEVAASLAVRNRFPVEKSLRLWTRHVLDALRQSRGFPTTIVRYADLLADGPREIDRIGASLDVRWPVAAEDRAARLGGLINNELRRQRVPKDAVIDDADFPAVEDLWRLVSDGGSALHCHETIDAIDREFSLLTADRQHATP